MLSWRTVRADDEPFRRSLFASTRAGELALTDWTDAQKAAFSTLQYELQQRAYRSQFPLGEFGVVEDNGQLVARLDLDRRADSIHVIDITVAPHLRNQGFGTRVLREVLRQGSAAELPVTLHVDQDNTAAQRWYERLGFRILNGEGRHLHLKWWPNDTKLEPADPARFQESQLP